MDFKYKEIDDLGQAYHIMRELRTKLSMADFISIYRQAKSTDQYTLLGAYQGNECVALMGYRLLFDFVHGKHLYIDDLVTTQSHRSKGIGAKLLTKAKKLLDNQAVATFVYAPVLKMKMVRNFTKEKG